MARTPSATDGLTEVVTEPITVVLAPEYIAPREYSLPRSLVRRDDEADTTLTTSLTDITDVTRHFARQGAALPLPSSEID